MRLRSSEWEVRPCALTDARALVAAFHYSKGGSNTAVYTHGLYRKADGWLAGVAWWLPPTRVACESVNYDDWRKVLSLSRLVCHPDCPKNAASFLIAGSIKLIRKDGRFVSLVTYADEYQQHTGGIYRATNWQYVGRTGPYPKWVTEDGRQVASLATKTRKKSEMLALGHKMIGSFHKHKFVMHLTRKEPQCPTP